MSIGEYFVSDEAKKAKNWEVLEQYKDAKAALGRLEHELKEITTSWSEMAKAFEMYRTGHTVRFNFGSNQMDAELQHDYPKPLPGHKTPTQILATVPMRYFDHDALKTLLSEIETTRKSVHELGSQLKTLGVELAS